MKSLTASDRAALLRLASSLPKGSEERRTILASLREAGHQKTYLPDAGKRAAGRVDPQKLKALQEEVSQNHGRFRKDDDDAYLAELIGLGSPGWMSMQPYWKALEASGHAAWKHGHLYGVNPRR
jgi:hypothetical protein